jgi:hypothetical protein
LTLTSLEPLDAKKTVVKVEEFRQSVGTVTTQPKDIGVLVVEIHRILQEKQLSHQEYLTHVKVAELKRLRSPQNIPENPTAIDEVSCNENGIESGIEYDSPPGFGTPCL